MCVCVKHSVQLMRNWCSAQLKPSIHHNKHKCFLETHNSTQLTWAFRLAV